MLSSLAKIGQPIIIGRWCGCPYLRHEVLEHLPVPRLEDAELPAGARRAHDVEGEDRHLAQRALHVLQCQAPPSTGKDELGQPHMTE